MNKREKTFLFLKYLKKTFLLKIKYNIEKKLSKYIRLKLEKLLGLNMNKKVYKYRNTLKKLFLLNIISISNKK